MGGTSNSMSLSNLVIDSLHKLSREQLIDRYCVLHCACISRATHPEQPLPSDSSDEEEMKEISNILQMDEVEIVAAGFETMVTQDGLTGIGDR